MWMNIDCNGYLKTKFRHTFTSWLALQGETILTIKELMGHKTLEMTMRYAHLMPDQKKRATVKLEKEFNEG